MICFKPSFCFSNLILNHLHLFEKVQKFHPHNLKFTNFFCYFFDTHIRPNFNLMINFLYEYIFGNIIGRSLKNCPIQK